MRILIADDHSLYRKAIVDLLGGIYEDAEFIEAEDYFDILKITSRDTEFDLVVLDLFMPGMEGFSGLKSLRGRLPDTPIVMISASEERDHAINAIEAGARGYVCKTSSADEIRKVFSRVLEGGIYLPHELIDKSKAEQVIKNMESKTGEVTDSLPSLTPRQMDVLVRVAKGDSNKQIAYDLGMAEGTVKIHVNAILKAMGAKNRTHAAILARNLGIDTRAVK